MFVLYSAFLPPPPPQAFFLEDVLVQTDYLKEIGADTGGGGGGGFLGGTGLEGLEGAAGEDTFACALCGKAGFRCDNVLAPEQELVFLLLRGGSRDCFCSQ